MHLKLDVNKYLITSCYDKRTFQIWNVEIGSVWNNLNFCSCKDIDRCYVLFGFYFSKD